MKKIFLVFLLLFLVLPFVKSEISVNLTSPIDFYNSSSQSVFFICNASEFNLTNISLYGNWSGGWHLNTTNKTYCYQETATSSTSCGGLATGEYTITSNYFYINYSKPVNATGGLWQVKFDSTGIGTQNITIPDSCFDKYTDEVWLRMYSYLDPGGTGYSRGQCYNDTGWSTITATAIGGGGTGSYGVSDASPNLYDGNWGTQASWVLYSTPHWASCISGGCLFSQLYEEAMYWVMSNASMNFSSTLTLPEGIFKWGCEACNSSDSCNTSFANRTLTIDKTAPTITRDYPSNGLFLNTNPYFNGTCTDSGIGVSTIWTNLTEYATKDLTSPFNFTNTSTLADGFYAVNLSCNDSINNLVSSFFNFTYDTTNSSANYSSPTPANGTTQTAGRDVTVNVTASDTNPWYAWMTFNATTVNNQTWTSGSNISFSVYNLPNGNYTYNVSVCDLAGNCNITGTYQINISNFDIGVYVSYPSESQSLSSTSFPYNVNMLYSVIYPGSVNCTYNVTGCSTDVPTSVPLDCALGHQDFDVNIPGTCSINIFANNTADGKTTLHTRTFTVTFSSSPGSPGGGSSNSILNCNNETQKWMIKTDRGSISQYMLMSPGDERTATLKIYNVGSNAVQLHLNCQEQDMSGICSYITFSEPTIVVPANSLSPASVDVTIDLKNYPDSSSVDDFTFTINADDGLGCNGKIDFVISKSVLGSFFVFDNIINAISSSFPIKIGDKTYNIPHWTMMLLLLSVTFTIGVILQNKKRFANKNVILSAFLIGIGLVIVYIALLVWLG